MEALCGSHRLNKMASGCYENKNFFLKNRPTLPKFLQEEIGNPHIFFLAQYLKSRKRGSIWQPKAEYFLEGCIKWHSSR